MRYEPAFDGIRGIVVTAVVLFHLDRGLLPGGWLGVDVFFVLSGYLITRNLMREYAACGAIDYRAFFISRFFRLAPALGVLLAFISVIALLLPKYRNEYLVSVATSLFYFMNWVRAFELWPRGVLGHTWSLSIEEQFYFVWPFAFMALARTRFVAITGAVFIAVTVWRFYLDATGASFGRTYNGFDTHCDGLLIGCIAAWLSTRLDFKALGASAPVPLGILAGMMFFVVEQNSWSATWGILLSSTLSAWLIISAPAHETLKKTLSMPLLVYTGKISYAWYLWHFPIFELAVYKFRPHEPCLRVAFDVGLFAASYIVAALSMRFVEAPAMRMKRAYLAARDTRLAGSPR